MIRSKLSPNILIQSRTAPCTFVQYPSSHSTTGLVADTENRAALQSTIFIFKSPLPTPAIFGLGRSIQVIMAGAEVAVPVVVLCAQLIKGACTNVLDADNDAQAFLMIGTNVQDDIDDAYMFHRQLMRHAGTEEELKVSAMKAIYKTEKAMEVFHERLAHAGKGGNLKWILSDRRAARSFLQPLQSAQSNLSRRIDWMRSALDRLANSANEEEGELPSSMPPKTSTMVRQ